MDGRIRVLVLEDHLVVGAGMAAALGAVDDLEVTGVVADLPSARSSIAVERPDVVLADIVLGEELALEFPAELGPGGPPVLFLSAHAAPSYLRRAVESGGAGFVSKTEPFEVVVEAIRRVARGDAVFGRRELAAARASPSPPTPREREVLAALVAGAANKEIASSLGIEERTVESHVRHLFDHYGVGSRVELAVLALREGWVEVPGG